MCKQGITKYNWRGSIAFRSAQLRLLRHYTTYAVLRDAGGGSLPESGEALKHHIVHYCHCIIHCNVIVYHERTLTFLVLISSVRR